MLVIPAIDIKEGKCVRLTHGKFNTKKIYQDAPEAVAEYFERVGAKRLHLVDLDGAESGSQANQSVVKKILATCKLPVQLGGGIRTPAQIEEWLNLGVERVIVGTMAVKQPTLLTTALKSFGAQRLVLAVDAQDGRVAIEGWQTDSGVSAVELALKFKAAGLERILYTDIQRDGALTGPNYQALKTVAQETGLRVIASGGISCTTDLEELAKFERYGVDSVVVGKAFYEKRIDPEELFNAG